MDFYVFVVMYILFLFKNVDLEKLFEKIIRDKSNEMQLETNEIKIY